MNLRCEVCVTSGPTRAVLRLCGALLHHCSDFLVLLSASATEDDREAASSSPFLLQKVQKVHTFKV